MKCMRPSVLRTTKYQLLCVCDVKDVVMFFLGGGGVRGGGGWWC